MIDSISREFYLKSKEIKVSINELISISDYYIEVSQVPPYNIIEREFSDTWADMYLDEDLKDKEGEDCFIINDNCVNSIRAIIVGSELTDTIKMALIDVMDNVIFDLLYNDIIDQISYDKGESFELEELYNNQSYTELLNYIKNNTELLEKTVSKCEYSWLLVLAENRLDLVTL